LAVMAITQGVSAVCWVQSTYRLLSHSYLLSFSQCVGLVMPRFGLHLVVNEP